MTAKLSAFSRLLSAAGLSAVAQAAPAAPSSAALAEAAAPVLDESGQPLVLETDATAAIQAAHAAGREEGIKAERERTASVLASEPGKANTPGAAFMLAETDAPAATIIAKLPAMGAPAAAAPAPPPAAAEEEPKPALSVPLKETPKVEIGAADPAAQQGPDAEKLWVETLKAGTSPFAVPALVEGGVPAGY